MAVLKTVITILFIAVCVILTIIILFQEGNSAGLGSLAGQRIESYWTKHKSRSREGVLVRVTSALVVAFCVLAALLNTALF